MPRVGSQTTRQALLVVGDGMETDPPPEKLELFTEDGLAVDVGKDRTRARWRGAWVPVPAAPYEQNDFVMHDEKLYILSDIDLYDGTSAPPAAGWAIMTISAGMQFFGEWAPGGYRKQSVVTRDNKLWASNVEIVDAEFEFVDNAWDSQYGGTDTISIPVPDGTQVGDIMIWAGHQSHYAKRSRPADYIDWVLLHSDGINNDGFPPGHAELYAKVVTEDDLGTDKVCTENTGENGTVQLLVFRNSGMPIAAEVDYQKYQIDSLPTVLTAAPGVDPAETQAEDKVVRIFLASAQNFAIDSGLFPDFSAGSDSQDELVFDIHQLFGGGSYWADAGASALSSFVWSSGEHKYTIRYVVRLPSPTGFNPDQWTVIGILEGGGGSGSVLALYDATQYNTMSSAFTYAGTEQIVIPEDGDYEINMSAALGNDNTTAANRCEAGPAVNGAVDAGLRMIKSAVSTAPYAVASHSVGDRVLSLTAGDIIRPMFKQVGGSLVYFEQVKIVVRPVTVE